MYFSLFSTCIPVKGNSRSIICDLQRHKYDFIPNSLYEILVSEDERTIPAIKQKHEHKYDETIDEYFSFLTENEYIFFTENPELYPPLNTQWHYPFPISNAIIDINQDSPSICKSLEWLEPAHCKNIQIRYFKSVQFKELEEICIFLAERNSDVQFLQCILPYSTEFQHKLKSLYTNYPRLSNLTFYGAPEEKFIRPLFENRGYTKYTSKVLNSCLDCGVIEQFRYAVNIQNFTESLHYNSCLNKKISIDVNGSIKNCPSMNESFGTIFSTSILEVLDNLTFTSIWNIKKDDIEKCKDCEFRYICTDCRAYLEHPEDIFSKPLKCGYDPYTATFADWTIDSQNESALRHYNLTKLSNGIVSE